MQLCQLIEKINLDSRSHSDQLSMLVKWLVFFQISRFELIFKPVQYLIFLSRTLHLHMLQLTQLSSER